MKQFLTYVNGAPFQPAIATGLALPDSFYAGVASTLRAKRDLLASGLEAAGFDVTRPDGTYFVVADAAPLGYSDGAQLCRDLPGLAGVVGVPISAFCGPALAAEYSSLVRFAFCKRVPVIEQAVAQLSALAR